MILSILGPFPVMDLCDAITRFDATQDAPWRYQHTIRRSDLRRAIQADIRGMAKLTASQINRS
jgi:hypothetical protein